MTLHPISGIARLAAGPSVERVVLIPWTPAATALPLAQWQTQPDADGAWGFHVPAGLYGVLYLADGCQPEFHGPYQAGS